MKSLFICFFIFVVIGVQAQYTQIPDPNFEQALIDIGIDTDGVINGQVATSDIDFVTSLDVFERGILDLTGIEDFVSLVYLDCSGNGLNDLDTSQNLLLEELYCSNNLITSLDLANNAQLVILDCNQNNLSTLNISNNILLEVLYCGNPTFDLGILNTIAELNLLMNTELRELYVSHLFFLTELDLSNNGELLQISASYCSLQDLDLSNNVLLEFLRLGFYSPLLTGQSNNLSSIDVSNNPNLSFLSVFNTNLNNLNVHNGNNSILTQMFAEENPNLNCIEVDDAIAANNGDFPYSEWLVDPQITYSEDCVLGVEELLIQQISVIPNPFDQMLFVESDPSIKIASLHIYSVLGELILSKTDNFNQIDLSSLRSGVYFLKINTEAGTITKKVVKK